MDYKKLCAMAIDAMGKSYSPYSGYKVGAALLCKNGKIFTGCNIENAAYSPSICAERTAIFKAVSEGEKEFEAIAVAGGKDGKIQGAFPPCGVCRQVMAEFCKEDFTVLVVTGEESFKEYKFKEILPEAFGPDYI
ncbi:MAG: cytidine deaminase [Clostridia bacterium]|nr:cytidine deaminase [Clostridia bacterium]